MGRGGKVEPCNDPTFPWFGQGVFHDTAPGICVNERDVRHDPAHDAEVLGYRPVPHPKEQDFARPVRSFESDGAKVAERSHVKNLNSVGFRPVRTISWNILRLASMHRTPDTADQTEAIGPRPPGGRLMTVWRPEPPARLAHNGAHRFPPSFSDPVVG